MIRDIFFELFKMCHQKKNFIPLAGYFLFLILCYIAFKTSNSMLTGILSALNPDRTEVAKYLDGFFFARIALVPTFIVLMPIVMATPGGVFGSTLAIMTLQEAVFRYCCATLYFSFSLMTLGTMALFFSTVFNRTSSGTLAVVTIYFVSYISAALPFAGKIRPWLISEVMNNAFLFWLTPLPTGKLYSNLTVLAMYIAGFLLAAIISFNYKDIR